MTTWRRAALALAIMIAGPAAAGRDNPAAKALAGREAGTPADCITLSASTNSEIVDARTILYRQGHRIWRTGPVGTCASLAPNRILIVEPFGAQLCRNDRFRTLTPNTSIPSGYCRFDRFTPYVRR
jgi:hypothetical protein